MAVPGPGEMAASLIGCCGCDEGELGVLFMQYHGPKYAAGIMPMRAARRAHGQL